MSFMNRKKKKSTLQVASQPCSECLFSPNRIVSQERKEEIVDQTLAKDHYFTCHKAMLARVDLCCWGLFVSHKDHSLVTRLAIQLNRLCCKK